ncbi:hypothetical protein B0H10DRAFT_988565 [Mycena sp. CBHHK59/15]|nr:hypothetical protein B0H10DRAFT_988565 [Mycena sp. CBHHK59/15]
MESRRSSTSRALPPYPSTPPTNTGWAALSDTKAASAMAVPPSYPAQPGEQGHFSPPLPSPFGSQSQIPRPGSVASSTRPETPQSESRPPYSSPSSSPPLLPLRLKVSSPPGPSLPLQRGTVNYSLATSYPTPHSSSVSSPSNSLASLPVKLRRLDVHHEANLSGSSESVSGGSNSSIRQELRQTAMPITPSSSALSSSSSSSSSANSQRPGQQPPSQPPSVDSPFVFPSSRSRARPATGSTPGVTGFKFRGRRKAKTPLATVQVLAPGTPIPSEGIFTAQPQPHPQIRAQISPAATASDAPRQQRAPPAAAQNLRLVKTVSAGSGSSGSGPGSPTSIPPTFYFPSARTRAHPKSSTPIIFNKGKKKDDGQGPSAQGPRFLLGMGLNRRRKAVVTDLRPQAAVPRDRTPSPMERTFLTLLPADEQHPTPTPEELRTSYEDAGSPDRAWAHPPPVVTKFNSYPLDAYDSTLIERSASFTLLRCGWLMVRAATGKRGSFCAS